MARTFLTAAFVIMILVTHLHCVIGAPWTAPSTGGSLAAPDRDAIPRGCDNPSGCICRGATLALPVQLPDCDLSWSSAIAPQHYAERRLSSANSGPVLGSAEFWKAHIPRGKLRALRQQFLL